MATEETVEERRNFHNSLSNLVKSEYEEIFRILKRSEEPYSENSNGIFFDIMSISTDTFDKMNKYMKFCIETREEQEERIKQLHEIANDVA